MSETNLRQAKAELHVMGVLSEKNLEIKTEDGHRFITGSLTISVDDTNSITVGVRQNEFTKEGKPNSVYTGLVTVMNEYKSVAEVGKDLADKVMINRGQVNPYHNANTNRDVVAYKTNFINRVREENFEPKAEVEVEIYVAGITPEMYTSGENQGEETGRVLLKGWMPTYNGIEPIVFVVPEEDGMAETVRSEFAVGQTYMIYADVHNTRVETIREVPVKIGKPRTERTVTYKNELLLTGCSESYEDIDNIEPYDKEAIQKAIVDREIRIEQAKKQSTNNTTQNSKPAPAQSGRPMPNF